MGRKTRKSKGGKYLTREHSKKSRKSPRTPRTPRTPRSPTPLSRTTLDRIFRIAAEHRMRNRVLQQQSSELGLDQPTQNNSPNVLDMLGLEPASTRSPPSQRN